VDKYYYVLLGAFGILFFLEAAARATTTILTTDEKLAYYTAIRPSISALFESSRTTALSADVFVYPLLTFFLLRSVQPLELAMRLSSITGYLLMMVAVFFFVRRRLHTGAALVAYGTALIIPVSQYAYQGRPYGLLLGWTGWVMLCWQRAAEVEARGRRGWLIGLSLSLAGALGSHFYAALLYLPLAAGESCRLAKNRRMDWPMFTVMALPACVIAAYIPFLRGVSVYSAHPWHGILFGDLSQTYLMLASAGVIGLFAAAGAIAAWPNGELPAHAGRSQGVSVPKREICAVGTLFLLPFAAFAVGLIVTRTYVFRYAISFAVAFAILAGWAVAASTYRRRNVCTYLGLMVLVYSQIALLPPLRHLGSNKEAEAIRTLPAGMFQQHQNLPVAVPNFDSYMTLQLYGPEFLKSRMTMIGDREEMLRATGTDNPWIAMSYLNQLEGFPLARYNEFRKTHSRFLMYSDYWLHDQVIRDGASVHSLGMAGPYPLYLVARD